MNYFTIVKEQPVIIFILQNLSSGKQTVVIAIPAIIMIADIANAIFFIQCSPLSAFIKDSYSSSESTSSRNASTNFSSIFLYPPTTLSSIFL